MEQTNQDMTIREVSSEGLEIRYVGKDSIEFKQFTDAHKAELVAVDGKFRWYVKEEDGTEYIVRPLEAQNK